MKSLEASGKTTVRQQLGCFAQTITLIHRSIFGRGFKTFDDRRLGSGNRPAYVRNGFPPGSGILSGSLLVVALCKFGVFAAPAAGPFVKWADDERNLPVVEFTAPLPVETVDPAGQSFPLPRDPFFLLGNYRLTLFPHVSGLYQLMTGERSWARVNAGDNAPGDNSATLSVVRGGATNRYELVGMNSLAADNNQCRRFFGTGYARWDFKPRPDLEVRRVISVPPSARVNEGVPAFVVNVRVANSGSTSAKFDYTESVLANYVAAIDRQAPPAAKLVTYTNRVKSDDNARLIQADISAVSKDPSLFKSRETASKYDGFPPSLVLHVASNGDGRMRSRLENTPLGSGRDRLAAHVEFDLQPGEVIDFNLVVGLAPNGKADDILALGRGLRATKDGEHFRADWQRRLPDLSREKDPVFRREMIWNAHALEAMATYSEYYGETFVPQGMTYDYEMDLTAAPRDHLQHALALSYTDPALAKSSLRFVLKKMTSQGEIPYTDYGFGKTSNSAWNTSDQQLYLFLAVAEYLRITGDTRFLVEETSFLPTDAKFQGTTLDKLDRAFMYLRDEIGTGPHGLIRLMNSDWSDMVYTEKSVLRHYWSAESHMNSAMAVAVLPSLIGQLERASASPVMAAQKDRATKLIAGLKRYEALIRKAFYDDLGDRTFSRRLYFDYSTPFGDDTMHIEPQSYLLLDADFPVERKRVLWNEIGRRLLNGESLGARQRETPPANQLFAPGTSENGGVWFALNGPMVAGVGTFDKPAARELLRRMTYANFARQFPGYWVGQWTAPDTLNSAVSGPIAGLPRPGDGGMWIPFAAYCAHAHAWPLYDYYRLNER